jgi:16S rRNA (cytidine1402-2'-O)-methyltransferase
MVQYPNGNGQYVPGTMAATLFLVATPIGNLEDITLRALRVLREVSLVAAEDTRRTARLLTHYDIRTPTTSFYEQVEREKTPRLLARLASGESLALVSDAGTPGISDPGYRLARAAIDAGHRVEAVPGPSSVLTALVASGLPTAAFSFVGFAPARQQARDRWLAEIGARRETVVFFEAPHRVRATLEALARIVGDRQVAVGRELTKVHEEMIRGKATDLVGQLTNYRGEFTIVLAGRNDEPSAETNISSSTIFDEFYQLTDRNGLSRREAISWLAERYNLSSRMVYRAIEEAKSSAKRP